MMGGYIYGIAFCLGVIFGVTIDNIIKRNNDIPISYQQGYKDAKLIYECDHDRAECEIIKDTL